MTILRVKLHNNIDVHDCKFYVWPKCKLKLIKCYHANVCSCNCATINNHKSNMMEICKVEMGNIVM